MKKFIIFAPPYNEMSGGIVCLHKLCHLLNETGREAYLYPSFENLEFNKKNVIEPILRLGRDYFRSMTPYPLNKSFNTPVLKNISSNHNWDEWVVVYYEQVFGNPLKAKHIVRWLLHTPGYHTKRIYYGSNELYFKFNQAIRDFIYPWSTLSKNELKIIHYPLEHYNTDGANKNRQGTAYCIRKGKGKKIQHDLRNSIFIDNKSHKEAADIFKKVKTFISYDSYTAYSLFAVLCGCESIVIPDEDVNEDTWYPDPADRYGISYGFEKLHHAEQTKHLVYDRILNEHQNSVDRVLAFTQEVDYFFSQPKFIFQRQRK